MGYVVFYLLLIRFFLTVQTRIHPQLCVEDHREGGGTMDTLDDIPTEIQEVT